MMAVIGFAVFAAALTASLAVFAVTLAPALPRIVSLLRDGVDPAFVPARVTFISEPRLRMRVATVRSVAQATWREAA